MSVFKRVPVIEQTHILLDGRPLDWYGLDPTSGVLAVESPDMATSYRTVPGMAGSHDLTLTDPLGAAYPGRRKVKLGVVAVGDDDEAVEARLRLGALIGRQTTIRYRSMPGAWHGRLSIGDWDERALGPRYVDAATTITLDAYPHLLGGPVTVRLAAGGNRIRVPGNRCAWPTFNLSVAVDSANQIGITDEHGHELYVQPGAPMSQGTRVDVDMRAGTARVNGNLTPVTLASDFFPLLPGVNVVTCTTGTVTFQPEWMI